MDKNSAVIDVLHPLTEFSLPRWVDSRDSPDIRRGAQPVFLGDSIYAKGWCDNKSTTWKYCIPTNSWSPFHFPPGVQPKDHTLAVYQSKLIWIGGRLPTRGIKAEFSNRIFISEQGNDWKDGATSIPSLPDDVDYSYLSASGDDDYLVLACNFSKILILSDQRWLSMNGPENYHIQSIIVHNRTLYMICQRDGSFIYKASLESLLAGPNENPWIRLNLPKAKKCPTLAVVGDHMTVVAEFDFQCFCVLGLSTTSDSWIQLTRLYFLSNDPSVVGSHTGTLFLMGRIRVKGADLQHPPGLSRGFPEFGMIEMAPRGIPWQ